MKTKEKALKLLFSDSGLGGISIMAEIANYLIKEKPVEYVELIFFNSTPDKIIGYNKMKSEAEKISVFNSALYSMKEKFNPDFIFIACNTLSVIFDQTKFAKEEQIPVRGIVEYGLKAMKEKLNNNFDSQLIILGTPTTINKNIYKLRLIEDGIDESKITNQSCPDLESEIQKNPQSLETKNLIHKYLSEATKQINDKIALIYLSLCCTHNGFAEEVFVSVLRDLGFKNFDIINPNDKMVEEIKLMLRGRVAEKTYLQCQVVSKVIFYEDELNSINKEIEKISLLVAESLRNYKMIDDLF